MLDRSEVTGLVLAGGLGRRMSADGRGVDKGLVQFRSRPLVAHVIERLAPQVGSLLINANRNLEAYAAFGYPVISDQVGGFAGPLAGLHAGLRAASAPWVVTAPCDSPFVPLDLVARLANGLQNAPTIGLAADGARVAVARVSGRAQPVFALVERSLVEHLGHFLASGERKIDLWYGSLPHVEVDFDDERAFRNINTATELTEFEPP